MLLSETKCDPPSLFVLAKDIRSVDFWKYVAVPLVLPSCESSLFRSCSLSDSLERFFLRCSWRTLFVNRYRTSSNVDVAPSTWLIGAGRRVDKVRLVKRFEVQCEWRTIPFHHSLQQRVSRLWTHPPLDHPPLIHLFKHGFFLLRVLISRPPPFVRQGIIVCSGFRRVFKGLFEFLSYRAPLALLKHFHKFHLDPFRHFTQQYLVRVIVGAEKSANTHRDMGRSPRSNYGMALFPSEHSLSISPFVLVPSEGSAYSLLRLHILPFIGA